VKLLLDTHIWVWSLLEPSRLGRKAVETLRDPSAELWLSPISLWEFMVMTEKGRIVLQEPVDRWIDAALGKVPLNEAPLTHEIARASRHLDLPHQDPADRFLAATAAVLGLTLVTADERLLAAKGFGVLAGR
jgi:PIN domain nuclease of toxin-antitoxin system